MFELVAAVADYPRFLPWCAGAHVRPNGDGKVDATIEIDYRGVRSRFTTCNDNRAPESIHMTLVEGPFRRLAGDWHFHALRDAGCRVHLQLHYDFAPGLLGRAIAPVFETVAASLVDSFARRAETLYEQD